MVPKTLTQGKGIMFMLLLLAAESTQGKQHFYSKNCINLYVLGASNSTISLEILQTISTTSVSNIKMTPYKLS